MEPQESAPVAANLGAQADNLVSRPIFERAYSEFCSRKGRHCALSVVCQGAHVILYDAFRAIIAAGGGEIISEASKWGAVAHSGCPGDVPVRQGASLHFRHMYETHLQDFEAFATRTGLLPKPSQAATAAADNASDRSGGAAPSAIQEAVPPREADVTQEPQLLERSSGPTAPVAPPPVRMANQGKKRPRSDSPLQPARSDSGGEPPTSPAAQSPTAVTAPRAATPSRMTASPARSGSAATGSTGRGRSKSRASNSGRKALLPHVLSNKAILPPHGRGRAPKVLPPLVMQRVATSNPTGGQSGSPGSPAASGSQGRSMRAKSDPRAKGDTRAKASPSSTTDPRAAAEPHLNARSRSNSEAREKASPRSNGDPRVRAQCQVQIQKSASGGKAHLSSSSSGSGGDRGGAASTASDAAAPADHADGRAEQNSAHQEQQEQQQQQPALPPVVEISNGVRLVGPYIGRGRTPSAPSCFHPSRARWQQQGFAETEQNFGEEPLAAMLGWLREAARQVGHGDLWAPPLLDSLEAREYAQGFRRWRKSVFEGQQPLPPPTAEAGSRRSGRHRGASSSALTGLTGKKNEREYLEEESDEEKETREGPQFQAQPPPLCIRKSGHEGGPPPAEAALLNRRLLPPAAARPPPRHAFVDLSAMTFEQRAEVVDRAVSRLRKAVGEKKASILGLDLIGGAVTTTRQWTDREAALLEEGMRLVGRDFRRIAVSLLPGRSEADLILYYYNVWKTRATQRSRAWFTALEEARAAEAAEEAAGKARLAELDAKRIAAQVVSTQTRQLRDALSWVRISARWPKDSLTRHKPRERAVRTMALLAANNLEN